MGSDKKKVVLIGSAYPLRGGLATYNERLIREYRDQGDDASIYTFSLQYPGFLFPGKTQYSTEPAPADLPIKVAINSVNPFNWIRIGREIKKMRPDLVLVKFWMPFMAPCFGTICRIIRRNWCRYLIIWRSLRRMAGVGKEGGGEQLWLLLLGTLLKCPS